MGGCPLVEMHEPCDDQDNDPFHAIGLNCTSLGGNYDNTNATPIFNETIEAYEVGLLRPWRVGSQFAAGYLPREGEKLLVISTSFVPGPDGGVLGDLNAMEDIDGMNGPYDTGTLPAPIVPFDGDTNPDPDIIDCNLVSDCSNTIQSTWTSNDATDVMWFRFDVTAPSVEKGYLADARGYKFDFAYVSMEFPDWLNFDWGNDTFIVWQSSSKYTGNVAFIDGRPITASSLWDDATGVKYIGQCPDGLDVPEIPGCTGNAPELEGTAMQTEGGGTGWYTVSGGVEPGETFSLMFVILDRSNGLWDSYAVIDNWRWDCEGCSPVGFADCGMEEQP